MVFSMHKRGVTSSIVGAGLAVVLAVPVAVAATITEPPSRNPTPGTSISLSRIESIPFKTIVVEDDSLPADIEVEKQPGSAGLRHIFTTDVYDDRFPPQIRSVVVTAPTDRVILKGTKIELPKAEAAPEPEPSPEPVVMADGGEDTASRSDVTEEVPPPATTSGEYSLNDLMFQGVIYWGGYKFTYYSQSVLPGGGLSIPGRHVNAGGFVSDGDGYIVLAGSAPMGTVYATPFGWSGKIYDRGTSGNHLDVYTR